MNFAESYEVCVLIDIMPGANITVCLTNDPMFADAMGFLFKRDTLESQIQRTYMQEERYELAIDVRLFFPLRPTISFYYYYYYY